MKPGLVAALFLACLLVACESAGDYGPVLGGIIPAPAGTTSGPLTATDFLRARTQTQLEAAFAPHVRTALAESGAFTALENFAGSAGLGGATSGLQADLKPHAVRLGLDGIFLYVAEEEKNIRENPLARTTDLLRKVFGAGV